MTRNLWRLCFLLAGAALFIGGPLHPDGTMAMMLGDPNWLISHVLMTISFALMATGLALWSPPPDALRVKTWLRPALVATIVQAVDMVVHTAAMVDHDRLVAGQSTPVLTTHLWMTVVVYPVFGATLIGFLVAAGRDRVLGSWWIAWMGMIGAAAHGIAGPAAVIWDLQLGLFGLIVLVGLWMMLAACWPSRTLGSRRPDAM